MAVSPGEHEGAGAVEHGVGHVADLGPGGRRRAQHRLEHLGGGDDRPAVGDAGGDDPLLVVGDVLQGAADAEVAPGHHDAVGDGDHLLEGVDRLLGLDLGHQHRPVGAARRPDPLDVGPRAHEGDGHRVDVGLAHDVEQAQVLRGGRLQREAGGGQGDARAAEQAAAGADPGHRPVAVDLLDGEGDAAVAEGHDVARPQVGDDVGVVDGDAAPVAGGSRRRPATSSTCVALGQVHLALEVGGPDLRAREGRPGRRRSGPPRPPPCGPGGCARGSPRPARGPATAGPCSCRRPSSGAGRRRSPTPGPPWPRSWCVAPWHDDRGRRTHPGG